MSRLYPIALLCLVVSLAACGRSSESVPGPVSAPASPATIAPDTAASLSPGAPDGIAGGMLAVALEGDVDHLGDTRYEAKGPEIRCAAVLIPPDGSEPQPATSIVEWRVTPADAGTFSVGGRGAYFLPAREGVAAIHAELPSGQGTKSPALSLSVRASAIQSSPGGPPPGP